MSVAWPGGSWEWILGRHDSRRVCVCLCVCAPVCVHICKCSSKHTICYCNTKHGAREAGGGQTVATWTDPPVHTMTAYSRPAYEIRAAVPLLCAFSFSKAVECVLFPSFPAGLLES